jgi:hypothetical protein
LAIEPSKSTTLTQTGVPPPPPPTEKSGRKIVGLHNQKIETELSAPEKSIIAREEVIHAGDEVEGEVKIDLYTTCFTKEIQTT